MPDQDLTIIGNNKNTLVCLSLIPSSNTPKGREKKSPNL